MNVNDIVVITVCIIVLVFMLTFGIVADWYQCKSKSIMQGLEYSWGPVQKCMVKQNGKWIDYDRLRYTDK